MSERLHVLGIRHHGPGSAASVLNALSAIDPSVILIEGPPDAESVLEFALAPNMRPPIALLIHAADDPAKSAFYPFADYSPEWQAIRWGLARKRTVRFMDLPVGMSLAERGDDAEREASEPSPSPLVRDPLTALASAAGESDGESWWNTLVEQRVHSRDVFPAIAEAMAAVREAIESDGAPDKRDTLREERREAHMRLAIRDALSETEGPVAAICGAWHVPALERQVAAKQDRDTLKGLKPVKTAATWVPWTDTRLAASSGYGAGVISPGWYKHLWRSLERGPINVLAMTAGWQALVAALLRRQGLVPGTASVIEASRLAVSLAALRGYAVPGLSEMQEATLSVLCQGENTLLKLIGKELVIGSEIGEIDDTVPRMPLLADLESWQKRLRLKPSASEEELSLDLRSEAGLLKSTLLHRLLLIHVPWGRKTEAAAGRGTFRERWSIVWQPELNVKLAEALRWGSTVEQAASGAATEATQSATGVAELAALVESCLHADLPATAENATARLQTIAVNSSDIAGLMRASAPLANVLRYGTARKIPAETLTQLIATMAAEICVGLAYATRGLDDDATALMHESMRAFDGAVSILDDAHREAWKTALLKVADDQQASSFLRGYAIRRLHDMDAVDSNDVSGALSLALSPAVAAADAGAWLEGFLSEAAQLLFHDATLLGLINEWLLQLDETAFTNLLPALRRALGGLDAMERRRLLQQITNARAGTVAIETSGADARAEAAFAAGLPLLELILGAGDER